MEEPKEGGTGGGIAITAFQYCELEMYEYQKPYLQQTLRSSEIPG